MLIIPYFPVTGSLNKPICIGLYVNIINKNIIIIKTYFAIILLHLNLLAISKYDVNSPINIAIIKEDMSIIGMFFPRIPVYV